MTTREKKGERHPFFRFAMLGSGSRGNGTVIQCGETVVLVDCGFMPKEAERRLQRIGLRPSDLSAILVTHEHADHICGVGRFSKKHRIPMWMTPGTYAGWKQPVASRVNNISPHDAFSIGELRIQPFPVPHDAREPCHFVFSNGHRRVGTLSDAGTVTDRMREVLSGCDALMLEFNHDAQMLADGPYARPLRERVGGPLGHLSNAQAADLVGSLDNSRLQHLVLTHISEKNNTPGHALAACAGALGGRPEWLAAAHQERGLPWRELH